MYVATGPKLRLEIEKNNFKAMNECINGSTEGLITTVKIEKCTTLLN